MAALSLPRRRRPARIGITPLVDVVFILMIFFMLASTFTQERQIVLNSSGDGAGANGRVAMLTVGPNALYWRGAVMDQAALASALAALPPDTALALRPIDGASVQRLIEAADIARSLGVANLVLAR